MIAADKSQHLFEWLAQRESYCPLSYWYRITLLKVEWAQERIKITIRWRIDGEQIKPVKTCRVHVLFSVITSVTKKEWTQFAFCKQRALIPIFFLLWVHSFVLFDKEEHRVQDVDSPFLLAWSWCWQILCKKAYSTVFDLDHQWQLSHLALCLVPFLLTWWDSQASRISLI